MLEKLSHADQAKLNGAKSKGPITIEGKQRSSANSIVHGFACTVNVVLRIEDEPAFIQHRDQTRACYKPADYAEQNFVDQIAAIQWRQSRLVALETALIDAQIGNHDENLRALYPDSADDEYFHLARAWQALAHQPPKPRPEDPPANTNTPPDGFDVNSIELVRRYQVSLDRQLRNAMVNLRQYRKDFASAPAVEPPPAAAPNEPRKLPQPPPPSYPEIAAEPLPTAPVRPVTPIFRL